MILHNECANENVTQKKHTKKTEPIPKSISNQCKFHPRKRYATHIFKNTENGTQKATENNLKSVQTNQKQ